MSTTTPEAPKPGRHRSFVHYSQAWYFEATNMSKREVDAVHITMGADEPVGGCDYELAIRWHVWRTEPGAAPRVEVYDEGWLAFAELADVFAWLASQHKRSPSPDDVCAALLLMGFVDRTERERPTS